ncbi:MAG: DUF3108 domain-containing protein [Myxococcales bacterium]|nr:DUF3108 domain-containing protein [Myxococcota bacterium]MDW8281268.1 DUF3108 domain-containing protein [Myxococcales bacterium]
MPCRASCCLLLVVALLGPGAREATGRPTRRGEAFTFRLRLGPIESGRARLAIAPPVPGPQGRQIHIVGEAEAVGLARVLTGLHDDYRLVLDADTLALRRLSLIEQGLRERTVTAEFHGPEADIQVQRPGDQRRITSRLPAPVRDPVAAFLVLRAARLADGDRLDLLVLDGTVLYEGHVEVVGRELLHAGGSQWPAIRLRCWGRRLQADGRPTDRPPREATLWLSDDRLRLPLRLQGETDLGLAQVELTSHEPPRRPLPPPRQLPGVQQRGPGLP